MNRMIPLVCFVLLATAVYCIAAPAQNKTLAIGSKAPAFNLKGFIVTAKGDYKEQRYQLKDFADAKLVLLIFTGNHCPTAQAYENRIKQLVKNYRPRGVAVVGITSNNPEALRLDELRFTDLGDTYAETKQRARQIGFDFPYLWDGDEQVMAQAYGAAATPHAFILDEQRVLRYQGRIDNNENPAKTTSHELRDALDALLQGQEPPVTQTRTFGCSIKWLSKKAAAKKDLAKMQKETASLETIDVAGIRDLVKNDTEKLRLINVWASWCAACVAEFPDIVNIHRIYRKRDFEIITISMDSMDQRDKALTFLNKEAASCRNTISSVEDRDQLADALDPQWNGVQPYTLLVAPGGEIIYRHTGMIEPVEVKRIIVDHLGRYFFKPEPKLSTPNLIISFETTGTDGRYSPKNVHAVWVEKADGTFVKTLDMWGKKRVKHLTTWAGAVGSMENEIQARTGATQKAYGVYSSKWDMKDADGNVVTDGDYIIRFELTSDNSDKNNYHRASVAFRKSETVSKIGPLDQGGYLNIVLDYSFKTDN